MSGGWVGCPQEHCLGYPSIQRKGISKWNPVRIIKRAGITGPKSGPHVLRNSFAVQFIAQGGDAITLAQILGHSTVEMSMRYAALSLDQVSAKHRQYSTLRGLIAMTPAVPADELPEVVLPDECYPPELLDHAKVHMWLGQHRPKGKAIAVTSLHRSPLFSGGR